MLLGGGETRRAAGSVCERRQATDEVALGEHRRRPALSEGHGWCRGRARSVHLRSADFTAVAKLTTE